MTKSPISTVPDPRSSADSAARADRELNAAIVSADISASYEEFIAIVDQFYAEDVEVRSDSANITTTTSRTVKGWDSVIFASPTSMASKRSTESIALVAQSFPGLAFRSAPVERLQGDPVCARQS